MTIKIIIADDHSIDRSGIRESLAHEIDIRVVAEAENGRELIQMVRELRPDVILTDIVMPGLNGIDATRKILVQFKNIRIIAISAYTDKRYVKAMVKIGASGYLAKDCLPCEIITAIKAAMHGGVYLSPSVAHEVISDLMSSVSLRDISESHFLSLKEREVLQLIAEGSQTEEISQILNISDRTVISRRRNIRKKTGWHADAHLTRYAIKEGLISLNA